MFIPAEATVFTGRQAALMVVSVLVLVVGLWAAYQANGGAEGRDFAGRLLAVGWVLGLRLMVLWVACFVLLFCIAVVLAAAANRAIPDSVIVAAAWGFALVTSLVFFWRSVHHLRDVRR